MKKFRIFQLSPPSEVDQLLDRHFTEFPSPRYRCVAEVFAKDEGQAFELTQADPGKWAAAVVQQLATEARMTLAGDVAVDVQTASAARFTLEGVERLNVQLVAQSFEWREAKFDRTQETEATEPEPRRIGIMKAREEKIGRLTLNRDEQGDFALSRSYAAHGEIKTQQLCYEASDAPAMVSVAKTIQSMEASYQKDRKEGASPPVNAEGKNAPLRKERVGRFDVAQFENKSAKFGTFAGYSVERSYVDGTNEKGETAFRTEGLNVSAMDAPSFAMAGNTAQSWASKDSKAEQSAEQDQALEQSR